MRNHNRGQGINSLKCTDLPVPREGELPSDHESGTGNTKDEGELEALEESRYFFEERDVFCFFGGCTPGHVDFKEVGQERLRHVEGNTAQEDGKEEEPFEVFVD